MGKGGGANAPRAPPLVTGLSEYCNHFSLPFLPPASPKCNVETQEKLQVHVSNQRGMGAGTEQFYLRDWVLSQALVYDCKMFLDKAIREWG